MIETKLDGTQTVTTVGSDTMDLNMADSIIASLNEMASELDRASAALVDNMSGLDAYMAISD